MQALPPGKMLAVRLPENELRPWIRDNLAIAAINSPELCVVSGPTDQVAAFGNDLEAGKFGEPVTCRLLRTSHAFHSSMMDPAVDQFAEAVVSTEFNPPQRPIISSVTVREMTAEEVTDPDYWCRQIRETVRFADALAQVLDDSAPVLLEVGPGQALSTLARQHTGRAAEQPVLSSLPHAQQETSAAAHGLTTLGRLWQAGVNVNWHTIYSREHRRRVHLPTYPFERERYWYDTGDVAADAPPAGEGFLSNGAGGPSTDAAALGLPADDIVQRVVQGQVRLMQQQLEAWKHGREQ